MTPEQIRTGPLAEVRPAIFLDVDGVLNHEAAFRAHSEAGHSGHYVLDPACVDRVLKLQRETGSIVVLSSTWRLLREARIVLAHAGIQIRGCTPRRPGDKRGHEIADWLAEHGVRPYVILDDDSDMLPGQPFVHVDGRAGLTDADCAVALAHLTNGGPR